MFNLHEAHKELDVAVYDLYQKCKDSNYEFCVSPLGDGKKVLLKHALIDGHGKVHDIVKSVALNAIVINDTLEDFSIKLVDPTKKV